MRTFLLARFFQALPLVAISFAIASCATTPVPTAEARDVPASRVLSSGMLTARDGLVRVIVKRDAGFSASACNTRVFVNGAAIAEVAPGERVVFYLPPGDHMLGALAGGICAGGLVETRAAIALGKAAIFRVSYGSSGEFAIQPTAF